MGLYQKLIKIQLLNFEHGWSENGIENKTS